jgi:hypothetical protein
MTLDECYYDPNVTRRQPESLLQFFRASPLVGLSLNWNGI